MHDERAAFERAELAGLMRQVGGRRAYDEDLGIMVWEVPAWECPHCVGLTGDRECAVQPGCPSPLARHGKFESRAEWKLRRARERGGDDG
jgi:hypothetical protein